MRLAGNWGSSDPRRANVVPKYYGVNTVDENLTRAGDGRHRRDRIMEVGGLALVDRSLAARARPRYVARAEIGRAIGVEPPARHTRSAAAA